MKCLTLWQPHATLVVAMMKRIETRSWQTNYRGELAIHAAGNFPPEARKLCSRDPFRAVLEGLGFNSWRDLPLGAVLGKCVLTEIFKIETQTLWPDGFITDFRIPPPEPELSFGDYSPGRFAWLVPGGETFTRPIPAKATRRRIWDWSN